MKLAKLIKTTALAAAVLSFSSFGFSSTETWKDFDDGFDTTGDNSAFDLSDNLIKATITAYKNDGQGNTLDSTILEHWGSNFGAGGEPSPQHSFDNVADSVNGGGGYNEFALIHFDWSVALEEIRIGWSGDTNYCPNNICQDTDISVLAWEGGLFDVNTDLAGLTVAELDGAGWTPISNFDANGNGWTSIYNDGTNSAGSTVSSVYWLVGAYSMAFSSIGCDAGICYEGNDYFKLKKLRGTHNDNGVPIPGTAALLALGLMLLRTRKTK